MPPSSLVASGTSGIFLNFCINLPTCTYINHVVSLWYVHFFANVVLNLSYKLCIYFWLEEIMSGFWLLRVSQPRVLANSNIRQKFIVDHNVVKSRASITVFLSVTLWDFTLNVCKISEQLDILNGCYRQKTIREILVWDEFQMLVPNYREYWFSNRHLF